MKSLQELMSLKERVALITGGAGHIGSVLAETLAELGANVILLDLDKEKCERVSKQIQDAYSIKVLALPFDLSHEDKFFSVPKIILDHFDRLDILVHCAALVGTSNLKGWGVPFKEQSLDTWKKALDVNLTSVFLLSQVCQEALMKSGHGSIINMGSIYGLVGPDMRLYEETNAGNPAAYAASKGGLLQLTRWLATTLAPHIRVNAITPGGIFRDHKEPFLSRYIEHTPLKRMATEEDLKGAVAYLASDLSSYVTGHNLIIDGGWTAW